MTAQPLGDLLVTNVDRDGWSDLDYTKWDNVLDAVCSGVERQLKLNTYSASAALVRARLDQRLAVWARNRASCLSPARQVAFADDSAARSYIHTAAYRIGVDVLRSAATPRGGLRNDGDAVEEVDGAELAARLVPLLPGGNLHKPMLDFAERSDKQRSLSRDLTRLVDTQLLCKDTYEAWHADLLTESNLALTTATRQQKKAATDLLNQRAARARQHAGAYVFALKRTWLRRKVLVDQGQLDRTHLTRDDCLPPGQADPMLDAIKALWRRTPKSYPWEQE